MEKEVYQEQEQKYMTKENTEKVMTVVAGAPHGITSRYEGQLEMMVHRRAYYEELRGNDGDKVVSSPFYFIFHTPEEEEEEKVEKVVSSFIFQSHISPLTTLYAINSLETEGFGLEGTSQKYDAWRKLTNYFFSSENENTKTKNKDKKEKKNEEKEGNTPVSFGLENNLPPNVNL